MGNHGNIEGVAELRYEWQFCTDLKVSLNLGFKNEIKRSS